MQILMTCRELSMMGSRTAPDLSGASVGKPDERIDAHVQLMAPILGTRED